MGLFSSFTKGLGAVLTGGTSSLMGSKDRGSYFDVLDPGNILHQGSAERTANEQWNLEYDLAKKNYEHTIDAYEYQKTLNEQQRQDNLHAVENRVNDLKSAGLSPTLAAGSAASVTPVHAGSAPQMVAPTHSKVEAAMFREQMEKDYMQLAMGMMSNMADISRTKAETELIAAQKNKLVQETPIDLRLKELEQQMSESTFHTRVKQIVQNESLNDLKIINEGLNARLKELSAGQEALRTVILAEQAKNAPTKYKSEADKLKEEVKEKTYAVKLAEQVYNYQETTGVPISAMSPVAKTFNPMTSTWSKKIKEGSLGREPSWQPKVRNALSNFWKKVQKGIGADYSVSGHGASRSF